MSEAPEARPEAARLVLQLGASATFLGHGWFAITKKAAWVPFITVWGFSESTALQLMPVVGVIDIMLAVLVLLRPVRGVLLWMTFWGLFTAALRPLTGLHFMDFVERGANWATPLALLLMRGTPRHWRDLFR